MPALVWNNFLAVWICVVLMSLAVGAYVYFDKQRPHDTARRFILAGCVISIVISVFMLLYDISIWLYIH
jgi:hypothetical protein